MLPAQHDVPSAHIMSEHKESAHTVSEHHTKHTTTTSNTRAPTTMSEHHKTTSLNKLLGALKLIKDIEYDYDDDDFFDEIGDLADTMMSRVSDVTGDALYRVSMSKPNQETLKKLYKIIDQFPTEQRSNNIDASSDEPDDAEEQDDLEDGDDDEGDSKPPSRLPVRNSPSGPPGPPGSHAHYYTHPQTHPAAATAAAAPSNPNVINMSHPRAQCLPHGNHSDDHLIATRLSLIGVSGVPTGNGKLNLDDLAAASYLMETANSTASAERNRQYSYQSAPSGTQSQCPSHHSHRSAASAPDPSWKRNAHAMEMPTRYEQQEYQGIRYGDPGPGSTGAGAAGGAGPYSNGGGGYYFYPQLGGSTVSASIQSEYSRRNVAQRFSNGSVATSSIHDHIAHSKNSSQQDHVFPTSTRALSDHLMFYPDFRSRARTSAASHGNNFLRNSGGGVGGGVGGASLQIQGNNGNHYNTTSLNGSGNIPVANSHEGIISNGNHDGTNRSALEKPGEKDANGEFIGEIVLDKSDRQYATSFSFAVLQEVESCEFRKRDITGKRHGLPLGFKGLACKYCQGNAGIGGRLFPSKIKTMSDTNKTLMPLYTHLMKCKDVPVPTKVNLQSFKDSHDKERKLKNKHGSQKMLFSRIWKRLHGYYPNE